MGNMNIIDKLLISAITIYCILFGIQLFSFFLDVLFLILMINFVILFCFVSSVYIKTKKPDPTEENDLYLYTVMHIYLSKLFFICLIMGTLVIISYADEKKPFIQLSYSVTITFAMLIYFGSFFAKMLYEKKHPQPDDNEQENKPNSFYIFFRRTICILTNAAAALFLLYSLAVFGKNARLVSLSFEVYLILFSFYTYIVFKLPEKSTVEKIFMTLLHILLLFIFAMWIGISFTKIGSQDASFYYVVWFFFWLLFISIFSIDNIGEVSIITKHFAFLVITGTTEKETADSALYYFY